MKQAIRHFRLDLNGLTVLTEAASGNYRFTCLAAAAAQGKVLAYGRDSRFGSFSDIKKNIHSIASELGVENNIEFIDSIDAQAVGAADIITNSGFLRPLNKEKLSAAKDSAVIPLMWETWEFRPEDLDVSYCWEKNIMVLGTNESFPYLSTMGYLGVVVKKLLFEAGVEVFRSRIGIIANKHFSHYISHSLQNEQVETIELKSGRAEILEFLKDADALVLADNTSEDLIIGKGGLVTAEEISQINPHLVLIHVAGNIATDEIRSNNISLLPSHIAPVKHMSVTTDYVGPRPAIDLNIAGLKVGEEMARARMSGGSLADQYAKALANPLCQDFSEELKLKYSRN
jgi:glycosyltransferase involved in cell wall biosynthesis